jgi:hypothetical protein
LITSGTVAPSLRPLADIAATESVDLADALGGADQLSAQQRLIVEDLVSVGIVLRATLARFLQTDGGDPELAARVGTLVGQRRASVALLGLQRVAREVEVGLSEERLLAAEQAAGRSLRAFITITPSECASNAPQRDVGSDDA